MYHRVVPPMHMPRHRVDDELSERVEKEADKLLKVDARALSFQQQLEVLLEKYDERKPGQHKNGQRTAVRQADAVTEATRHGRQ